MTEKPKFNFGDTVFHARCENTEQWVECVDCSGTGYVTIIYQGETFTLDCEGCNRGFMGSTGRRLSYSYSPTVLVGIISGVQRECWEPFGFEYRISIAPGTSWVLKECDTFCIREDAEARAAVLCQELMERENAKINTKHKPDTDKSWAWNVNYHMNNIKRMQKDIEYHTLQLNAARKHRNKRLPHD